MPQIDARALDHSPQMRRFFEAVKRALVERHHRDRRTADVLVDRFFSLDVDPLERALVMHQPPEQVAAELPRRMPDRITLTAPATVT